MSENTPATSTEATETKIPAKVYCVLDTFQIWLADSTKLYVPKDKLHLGDFYQLIQATVKDSRIDEDGHLRLLLHVDSEAEDDFPACIWCIPGEHCWYNAKDATMALLKKRISEETRTMQTVLELPDIIDKHDGLLDGPLEEDDNENKGDYSTGDWIMLWNTRVAPVLGHFVNDVAKLLIQYRRLRKEEQEADHDR